MERIVVEHARAVEEAEQNTAGFRATVATHHTELESELLRHREQITEANRKVVELTTAMIDDVEQRAAS